MRKPRPKPNPVTVARAHLASRLERLTMDEPFRFTVYSPSPYNYRDEIDRRIIVAWNGIVLDPMSLAIRIEELLNEAYRKGEL